MYIGSSNKEDPGHNQKILYTLYINSCIYIHLPLPVSRFCLSSNAVVSRLAICLVTLCNLFVKDYFSE